MRRGRHGKSGAVTGRDQFIRSVQVVSQGKKEKKKSKRGVFRFLTVLVISRFLVALASSGRSVFMRGTISEHFDKEFAVEFHSGRDWCVVTDTAVFFYPSLPLLVFTAVRFMLFNYRPLGLPYRTFLNGQKIAYEWV